MKITLLNVSVHIMILHVFNEDVFISYYVRYRRYSGEQDRNSSYLQFLP